MAIAAMHVQIDKTRRQIISIKIDNITFQGLRLLAELLNFPLLGHDFQAFTNSIRKNEARVSENHLSLGKAPSNQ